MKKHNNIQDRIKLLMEYDTSKTYSENKEFINEGWRDIISNIIKSDAYKFLKKRWVQTHKTPDFYKKEFIKKWVDKYSKPESVAKSLKEFGNKDLSSKIVNDLIELKKIENEIIKTFKIIENPKGVPGESINTAKDTLNKLIDNYLIIQNNILEKYLSGLESLLQINTSLSPNIVKTDYLNEIINLVNTSKITTSPTTKQQFNTIKKEINNIYKKFNDEVFIKTTTPQQQKWSIFLTLMSVFRIYADFSILKYIFYDLTREIDAPIIRDKSRIQPLVKTYCTSYGRACDSSSSIFCTYSNIVGENLRQNQLILLYTLIYGVLTKKSILKNTTSEEFCSFLIKNKVSNIDFVKDEKFLKKSILRSLYEYKTTNTELYKLFMNVWVKNKQIIIDSNVTGNLYENAKNFIVSNFSNKSLNESKIITTNFKRVLNEQQPKPIKQQPKPTEPQQASTIATSIAGIGMFIQKYGSKALPFLKKLLEKSSGKTYGKIGIIASILTYTNIPKNIWVFIANTLNATESTAFIDLFKVNCGHIRRGESEDGKITYTHKRNQSDASLNFYIEIFNDRTFFENYITDLNKNTINMALWAIFGDYVKGTNLFTMSDLCYINAKTNGEFANEFQKFYNNLPNLTIDQFKASSNININAFNRAWKRLLQAPWGKKFNKIKLVITGEKNADERYKSEFRNELALMKKINHEKMLNYYLNQNHNIITNNPDDVNF